MARLMLWLLTAILLAGLVPAAAADVYTAIPGPVLMAVEAEPPAAVEPAAQTGPLMPAPQIRYGCQRVWRCDSMVCEWRRGCWGVYGYVEGPYFTAAFARRQWKSHALPVPQHKRRRKTSH